MVRLIAVPPPPRHGEMRTPKRSTTLAPGASEPTVASTEPAAPLAGAVTEPEVTAAGTVAL